MMRKRIGDAPLRVVVPDFAKSAGTLMALGSDAVVMSDTSELGPIDPQIVRCDVNGNRIAHSIFNYLHAYEGLRTELAANPYESGHPMDDDAGRQVADHSGAAAQFA